MSRSPTPNGSRSILSSDTTARTSYRRVATQLRQEILDGEFQPGSWLRMAQVAKRCGVSVQPVREALQQLQGEGLVEIIPNRGARVRGLDRVRLIHIFEMIEALESFTSRRFAEEATLRDLGELQALQKQHDEAIDARNRPRISKVNIAIHRLINAHSGNSDIIDLWTRYSDLVRSLRLHYRPPESYFIRVKREHHLLLDAFRDRDAASAANIGANHVRATREELVAHFDQPVPERPSAARSQVGLFV